MPTNKNERIAAHGQTYLRPPGLEALNSSGYYGDQEQIGTPMQPDDTFLPEEDEDGFPPSGEVEEFEDEIEELEEEEQVSNRLSRAEQLGSRRGYRGSSV